MGRIVIDVPNLVVNLKQCLLIQYGGYWLLMDAVYDSPCGLIVLQGNCCRVCEEATMVPPLVCGLVDVELEIFVCAHGPRRHSSYEVFWGHLQGNLTSINFVSPISPKLKAHMLHMSCNANILCSKPMLPSAETNKWGVGSKLSIYQGALLLLLLYS